MTTIADRKNFIKNLIQRGGPLSPEENVTLMEMYAKHYHNDFKIPLDSIISFCVDFANIPTFAHKKEKCIYVQYRHNGALLRKSLSKNSLAGVALSKMSKLKQACRLAVNDDILAFSKKHGAVPGIHHVDHVVPFCTLFERFLEIKNYPKQRIQNLQFYQSKVTNDDAIIDEWVAYHTANATLQILTVSENFAKGSKTPLKDSQTKP